VTSFESAGTATACPTCGLPLDTHNRHVRFQLPDPVLALPERDRTAGTWLSHQDANTSVMMQVPNLGGFVRVLLPVQLTGAYTVTFGVWLGVHPDDLRRAFKVWWEPEYKDLQLEGRLANALPNWGLLGAPATTVVQDTDATPYVVQSSDPVLSQVLSNEWSHAAVLASLP
jgi:hypothetical protein